MATQRRAEISHLNILLCMLVLFIHINSYSVAALPVGTLSYNAAMFPWRLLAINFRGFVLLSGVKLFLTKKDEQGYGKYLVSRIKHVILPYVFCYFVYYAFYYIAYDYPLDAKFILKNLLLGSLACHFYFIPLIFQFDLLFPVWKRVINKCSLVIIIPFALLLSLIFELNLPQMIQVVLPDSDFSYNDRIFTTYLSYWIIGCYIGKHYEKFVEILKNSYKTICCCFLICLVLCVYYTYHAYNYVTYIPYMNHINNLYVTFALIFLYALFIKLPQRTPRLLQEIDKASYDIYLWHMMFILIADKVISILNIQSLLLGFVTRVFFVYVLEITGCIILNKLKRKIRKKRRELRCS